MRRSLLYTAMTRFEDDNADGKLEATCLLFDHLGIGDKHAAYLDAVILSRLH